LEALSLEQALVMLLLLTLVTLFTYLVYSGLWTSITVTTEEPHYGPLTIAYKSGRGPYREAGNLFTESYCLLPHREQVGLYYDDPEGVPASELRYAVGPILARGEEKPDGEEMEKMRSEGFKIAHFPRPSYVVSATFPFTTTLSIYLGIFRVYPRLRDYIAERSLCAYPAMEVYTDSEIIFMMPLSKQDEFFVSEFQEDEVSIATTTVMGEDSEMSKVDESSLNVDRKEILKEDREEESFLSQSTPTPREPKEEEEEGADEVETIEDKYSVVVGDLEGESPQTRNN